MSKEKIINGLNIVIPYLLFFYALTVFYVLLEHTLQSFITKPVSSELDVISFYFYGISTICLLIGAGVNLKKKKRRGIIIFWIYIIFLTTGLTSLPTIKNIRGSDIISILIAVYITLANWKKWNPKTSK
jgi:hypothetical protein